MVLCAYEVMNDTMKASDVVLIQGFILSLYRPLGSLAGFYRLITNNLIDVENMFDILNHPVDVLDVRFPFCIFEEMFHKDCKN